MKILLKLLSVALLNKEGGEILSPFGSLFFGDFLNPDSSKVRLTTCSASCAIYLAIFSIINSQFQNSTQSVDLTS